jgi:uncharacterized protein YciI
MKQVNKFSLLFLFAILLVIKNGFAQVDARMQPADATGETVKTEKKASEKIEQYWFVILKTGPKPILDSAHKVKLFEGHMANIKRLYNAGILKVAGPFGKNDLKWRGIFILDCKTKEEAEKIVATDPAVEAGLFAVDIVPWFSEATGSFIHGRPEIPVD